VSKRILVFIVSLAAMIVLSCWTASAERIPYDIEDVSLKSTFDVVYEDGLYLCGRDIEPGSYVILLDVSLQDAFDKYFASYTVSTDSHQNDIIYIEIIGGSGMATIKEGEYFDLFCCFAVREEEFYSKYMIRPSDDFLNATDYGTYMLKVGEDYDIDPGQYTLHRLEGCESLHYEIFSSSYLSYENGTDYFWDDEHERADVTLRDGEYLYLQGCNIDIESAAPAVSEQDHESDRDVVPEHETADLTFGRFTIPVSERWTVWNSDEQNNTARLLCEYKTLLFADIEYADIAPFLSDYGDIQLDTMDLMMYTFKEYMREHNIKESQIYEKKLDNGIAATCCFPVGNDGETVNYVCALFDGTETVIFDFFPYTDMAVCDELLNAITVR